MTSIAADTLKKPVPRKSIKTVRTGKAKAEAFRLLAESNAKFDQGRYGVASALAWEAVQLSLVQIAIERGWQADTNSDLDKTAERLDKEFPGDIMIGGFLNALEVSYNSDGQWLTPEELSFYLPLIPRYVDRLLETRAPADT